MGWRTCIMWVLLTVAQGEEYTSSPSELGYTPTTPRPGYTPQVVSSSLTSQYNSPASRSGPALASYTTSATTPLITSTTPAYPNDDKTYSLKDSPSYPCPSSEHYTFSLPQQYHPYLISQYYKQPPYYYQHPQVYTSHSFQPRPYQPPGSSLPDGSFLYHRQPHVQTAVVQTPNPLTFLGGFIPHVSLSTMVSPRGPLPSPGSPYTPTSPPPPHQLFRPVHYTPVNHPSPYGAHFH